MKSKMGRFDGKIIDLSIKSLLVCTFELIGKLFFLCIIKIILSAHLKYKDFFVRKSN